MEVEITELELNKIKNMFPDQEIESIKATWEGDRKHISIFLKGFINELHTYIPIDDTPQNRF